AAPPTTTADSAGSAWTLSTSSDRPSERKTPESLSSAETAIRYYGRRKGKPLKAGRKSLLDELLPKVRLPKSDGSYDPKSAFAFSPSAVSLEIGFGAGEHLAAQAAANPSEGFIGSEVFLNGVASIIRHIHEQNLTNVRIYDEDVRRLLPVLKDASLKRIFLLFPDPWPKTRHAKRRFVSAEMLGEMARLLTDGGELRVASDHPVYVRWTLRHASQHPDFRWVVEGPEDWRNRPADSVPTRYEEKAHKEGRAPVFLTFRRQARRG
ncbi:MAG: tRNA (guanosine(46)-N7)-methyltransferase TrmB, partial [Rhodospirillaceae bacterium]